ncbi:DNA repair ATPase SMC5 KNAG_0L00630 [Huiozyma naganishii CBS 8797]|uniref:Structural maintenance of chromosomes protein 5 n=1 Tax=Huiozyma naganishii (strain ATCC MYA-139 / BCRC 22969 / CBS 8797 / KCTC 17520 / NBRC 10181 / NCYC 3082 / Yp74L-3) TaxID=1071383 RepID=J7SB28_HUIN7|nr:hypothetical protein KNAG_0L00630 [Kazachstania naganishii CBS 8797]CCK72686.1 hypothetical protein KNAG_0L00630 [Kazachstania naganishii CBS 8797]
MHETVGKRARVSDGGDADGQRRRVKDRRVGEGAEVADDNDRREPAVPRVAGFAPGNVVRLRLHNFVTYSLAEFEFSPSLNMVVGPNGSGKSTLVCALCLGLAGRTEYLGRMKRSDSFIKNGADSARIDVWLAGEDPGTTLKVSRVLTRNHKKASLYYVDGVETSEQRVRQLVATQHNIQLDNLCQFLSQERVQEFARLRPDKLLLETVRACDRQLLDCWTQLAQLQREHISLDKEVQLERETSRTSPRSRQDSEGAVSALRTYENTRKQIMTHNQLLPYAQIKEHKASLTRYKTEYQVAKRQLQALLNDKKPFQQLLESLASGSTQEDRAAAKESLTRARIALQELAVQLALLRDNTRDTGTQVAVYRNRTHTIAAEITELETAAEQQQAELVVAKEKIPPQPAVDELTAQKAQLFEEQQRAADAVAELVANEARTVAREHDRLHRELHDTKKRLLGKDRISVLETGHNGGRDQREYEELKRAVLYLRAHADTFANDVVEPPILAVQAQDPLLASYLNRCVDANTSRALTIGNSAAYAQHSESLLSRFKVNLRELRQGYQRKQPVASEELHRYGFEGYLIDFVRGDPQVIEMLCQQSNIHAIPVSRRELTVEQLKALTEPREGRPALFKKFISGRNLVTVNTSLYSRQTFSTEVEIGSTNLYQQSVLTEQQRRELTSTVQRFEGQIKEKREQLDEISARKSKLQHREQELKREGQRIGNKLSEFNRLRSHYSSLGEKLAATKRKLEQKRHDSRTDVTPKIAQLEAQIAQNLVDQTGKIRQMVRLNTKLQAAQTQSLEADIGFFEVRNRQAALSEVIGAFNEQETTLTREYREKRDQIETMRNTAEYKLWVEQIKGYDDALKDQLNELAEKYESQGDFNTEYIGEQVERLESEIRMINHDESSIAILQEVERKLADVKARLPAMVRKLDAATASMSTMQAELEPRLDTIVEKISERFTNLFTNVGSAGAIQLSKPHLYQEWEMKIMVKFRDNAPLKRLDSHTQSGGERAVSTVLYIIALQEFTSAPFRVVDEINQGMDQRNERIVHKAMVQSACADNTSQYFLITPKLLTDLYYHEKMRIHCVMAGPWVPDSLKDPEMVHFGETTKYVM